MNSISILESAGTFAENKDIAARIREDFVRPLVNDNIKIIIDFSGVTLTTQSFIHALISDVLRKGGEKTLEIISFKGCIQAVREIIETVVQYSLESQDT